MVDEVFEDSLFKDVPNMSVLFCFGKPESSSDCWRPKCRGPVLDYVHHRCIFVNSCIGILMIMMMMMMMVMLLVVAVAAASAVVVVVVVVFAGNDGCKFSKDGHCH